MENDIRLILKNASTTADEEELIRYTNLKLACLGCPTAVTDASTEYDGMVASLLSRYQESDRLLADYLQHSI